MLQSSNHYLRPDYLTAPPTTLDNKSSPLALLAQTCSAIGADTANPKLLAANIEKSTKSLKSGNGLNSNNINNNNNISADGRDKSSPVSSHSSSVSTGSVEQQQQVQQHQQQQQQQQAHLQHQQQPPSCKPIGATFKPYETNNNHIRERLDADGATNLTSNQRVKTPKGSGGGGGQSNGQRCDSNQSASSQRDSPAATNGLRRTPSTVSAGGGGGGGGALDLQQRSPGLQPRISSKESATNAATSPSPAAAAGSTRLQAASEAALAAAAKEASYVKALHAAAAAAAAGGMPPTTSAGGGGGAGPYYANYASAAAAAAAAAGGMSYPMDLMTASALMSPHHPMFKAAAMNPYLNYARLKGLDSSAAAAAAMMSPNVCRDPYCTGCPSSPHFLNKAAGQPCPAGCSQCESSNGAAHKSGTSGGSNAAAAAAAAAASSYHAQLAALAAASQLPYVCSWIGGDAAYCGKRFGNSDELFQHLRTHTASMPDSVLSAAAAGGIPPNHPLFQRTYPTPPLSPLSAARYHPYGKPSMLPPSLAPPGIPGLPPHPALAQYFSPYSLYGPRMGSSHQ